MGPEYHKWHSPALGRDMELKVYGSGGRPILVFPSSGGRFYDFEDFGMIAACDAFIDSRRATFFTVDGVDNESWLNQDLPPDARVRRHEQYERHILDEVIPFIKAKLGSDIPPLAAGCSMGGYHAANFLFRRPDVFDSLISLSGLYGPEFIFGDQAGASCYFHFPLMYLPGLNDPWHLERLRRADIVLCVGRGPWEACGQYDCIRDTQALQRILEEKSIPAWVDYWGEDAAHDWDWWRKQLPYFLEKLV